MRRWLLSAHPASITRSGDIAVALVFLCVALSFAETWFDTAQGPPSANVGVERGLDLLAIALILQGVASGRRKITTRLGVLTQAAAGKEQVDELFALTDMLQSAETHADATNILHATAIKILPDLGTALYIFNEAGDALALTVACNMPAGTRPATMLAASNCWALKRGRSHLNDPSSNNLCCEHHVGTGATLEFPMQARGVAFGLLKFVAEGPDAARRLMASEKIGHALADSVSLALSNIRLREQLREESLTDPLTGLYNRGLFDAALGRCQSLAGRGGDLLSLVMIDLDHFKAINDAQGHVVGDAVLRAVARVLRQDLRGTDIACRYGGEELALIMPDCPLEVALAKAEAIRAAIAALAGEFGFAITASLGVASTGPDATNRRSVLQSADRALYRAKELGRNRVEAAAR